MPVMLMGDDDKGKREATLMEDEEPEFTSVQAWTPVVAILE